MLQNVGEGKTSVMLDDFAQIAGVKVKGFGNAVQRGCVAVLVNIDEYVRKLVLPQLQIVHFVTAFHVEPHQMHHQRRNMAGYHALAQRKLIELLDDGHGECVSDIGVSSGVEGQ